MEELWFNKAGNTDRPMATNDTRGAGTLSRGQQRLINRANSNYYDDPRNNRNNVTYAPVVYATPEQEQASETERINKLLQEGQDMAACIGKYKVAPCIDDYMREQAAWMKRGRTGTMPIKNACVENELKKSEKKKLTKAQAAEILQEMVKTNREKLVLVMEEPTASYSGLSENITYAPRGPLVQEQEEIGREKKHVREDMGIPNLQRQTCDEIFNQMIKTDSGLVREHLKMTAIQCLSKCSDSIRNYRDQAKQIKDMESSPRYENSIQEYGKEYTDIRIANKKASVCAQKKIQAWQCKNHRVETTEEKFIKYAPYIIGGVILYLILKK